MAGIDASEVTRRVHHMLKVVRLPGVESRLPGQLSGGQQKRIALARALATNPKVLLLDEPLAALDRHLREEMQFELRRLQSDLGITTMIVTHDQEEALTMSDTIIVMDHGRVIQTGAPQDVYDRPDSRFIAEFLGTANLFEGHHDGSGRVVLPGSGGDRIIARTTHAEARGTATLVAVRPEKIALYPLGSSLPEGGETWLDGAVSGRVFRGSSHVFEVRLNASDRTIVIYRLASDVGQTGLEPGTQVRVGWQPDNAVLLPDDTAPGGGISS